MGNFLILGALLYVIEKLGLFGWVAKFIGARLPREKSMTVKRLFKTKTSTVTYQTSMEGSVSILALNIEYLDAVIVVTTECYQYVIPYTALLFIKSSGEKK